MNKILCPKKYLLWSLLFSLFVAGGAFAKETSASSIQWLTNYDEALKQSKATSKPIVLFFTGSDWCGWCTKLEEEALNTQEFANVVKDKLIFVKLDFPLNTAQDPAIKQQNKQKQDMFKVRSFPTIILIDAQQNQIGSTGYRPGGGKAFGEYLLKLVQDYSGYKQKMSALKTTPLPGSDLKQLYAKSIELNRPSDTEQIMIAGFSSDASQFFLIEQYRSLGNKGQIHTEEALTIRKKLGTAPSLEGQGIHYQLALIEFESRCRELDKDLCATDEAILPLLSYIEKYGHLDKDNLWRLKFIISQVYLDKNNMSSALKYAEESYTSAPDSIKPEIQLAINMIHSQIKETQPTQ